MSVGRSHHLVIFAFDLLFPDGGDIAKCQLPFRNLVLMPVW